MGRGNRMRMSATRTDTSSSFEGIVGLLGLRQAQDERGSTLTPTLSQDGRGGRGAGGRPAGRPYGCGISGG